MYLQELVRNDTARAAEGLQRAGELLEMIEIEAAGDFDRICTEAGLPASLVRNLIRWVKARGEEQTQTRPTDRSVSCPVKGDSRAAHFQSAKSAKPSAQGKP
jgi:hypothetical protein